MPRLKLAFVGNMNNMPLMYARVIRDLGHSVDFFVDAPPREKLHRPECRYPEYSEYPEWMADVHAPIPLVAYVFSEVFFSGLISRLNSDGYDGIVLDGFAVSLGTLLKPPKFALLAGSDLDIVCDPLTLNRSKFTESSGLVKGWARLLLHKRLLKRQRAGLRSCTGFNYFPEGINRRGDELLQEIYAGCPPPYRLQVRGTDVDQLCYVDPSERTGDDVIILVGARHLWREPLPAAFSPPENKRNDLIIRGIAKFLEESDCSPRFVMVEKGPHVEASKSLARQLGIGDRLCWIKEVTQAEIFQFYRKSDIVIDQLGDHMMGAVGWDSMLTGRPVIANNRPEVLQKLIAEECPVCQARTDKEVADWLHRLVNDPGLRREIGRASRTYIERNHNMKHTAEALIAFFEQIRAVPPHPPLTQARNRQSQLARGLLR